MYPGLVIVDESILTEQIVILVTVPTRSDLLNIFYQKKGKGLKFQKKYYLKLQTYTNVCLQAWVH